jgi:ectoine hydroxylase-related dioxygenase (phytanoyl-CoA dioxygenase family)
MTSGRASACEWVEQDGFTLVEGVFAEDEVSNLRNIVKAETTTATGRGGVRNLLDIPEMCKLAQSVALRMLVDPVLGPEARIVRGILFDKTNGANWKVPWHQDVTIAVSHRFDVAGYGPWSMKAGVLHVQPPAEILQEMLSVRLHLDDCPEENGALRVIPGSHLKGKLPADFMKNSSEGKRAVVCAMKSGGVLLMRPLLLHASSAATSPAHRRVIHFDYASANLPSGLGWAVAQA